MVNGVLVRTDLTDAEWREIRKLALDRGKPVRTVAGDALRKLLKGAR